MTVLSDATQMLNGDTLMLLMNGFFEHFVEECKIKIYFYSKALPRRNIELFNSNKDFPFLPCASTTATFRLFPFCDLVKFPDLFQ